MSRNRSNNTNNNKTTTRTQNNPFSSSSSSSSSSSESNASSNDSLFDSDHDDHIHDHALSRHRQKQQQQQQTAALDIVSSSSDDNNDDGNNDSESIVPIESSWQFLGDLPYRRIVLYDNVDWGSTVTAASDAHDSNSNGDGLTSGGGGGGGSTAIEDGYGATNGTRGTLACVLPQTIASMQSNAPHLFPNSHHHHNPHNNTNTNTNTPNPRDVAQFLSSTTTTLIASCPNGGPIATVTKPLLSTNNSTTIPSMGMRAPIRIMTGSGRLLATIDFPPSVVAATGTNGKGGGGGRSGGGSNKRIYVAGDILTMGFTDRWMLVLVLRDSLCMTYDLSGNPVLPPFSILTNAASSGIGGGISGGGGGGGISGSGGGALELIEATVYDGGVAVLSANMTTAVVEFLDTVEDCDYRMACHVAAREVHPSDWNVTASITTHTIDEPPIHSEQQHPSTTTRNQRPPTQRRRYALITPLSTATHATRNYLTYTSLAVLPRIHTNSRHPELFLGTSTHSVLIVSTATGELSDVGLSSSSSGGGAAAQQQPNTVANSPVVKMSFAPNGRFLACFTEQLILTVVSSNFQMKVVDFDTGDGSGGEVPGSLEWCGEDSVVLCWRGRVGVLMVGPYGDWLRFPYYRSGGGGGDGDDDDDDDDEDDDDRGEEEEGNDNIHIRPEMDGCRIITDRTVEILQRVPPSTAALLRIGSIEPGAMLLDANDAFERGDGDQTARREIEGGSEMRVEEAIEVCTDAAMREFDVGMQKRLLRAASYGMHFAYKKESTNTAAGSSGNGTNPNGNNRGSTSYIENDPHRTQQQQPPPSAIAFVNRARKLRVLNALRHPSVGFLLTSDQYDSITPDGVIARLIAMKRPALATSLASYLRLDESVKAYARAARAAAFVAQDDANNNNNNNNNAQLNLNTTTSTKSDGETAERAMQILTEGVRDASVNRGGYAAVALAADRAKRRGVATLLLTLETSVWDKVPALAEIGLHADAAAVATAARNPDLIFRSLLEFEKHCLDSNTDTTQGQNTYLDSVVKKFSPEAVNILSSYFGSMQDVKHVMNLQSWGHKYINAGSIIAKRALSSPTENERMKMLKDASRIFSSSHNKTPFQKACTDDYIELINEQERLRHTYGSDISPKTSSVTDTIFHLLFHASDASVNLRETHKLLAEGEKLAKKFKVPEKRLWHVKVRAFAGSGQWGNLRSLAESKSKPPISFRYFALAVIRGKQGVGEIVRYTEKVVDEEERYDLFCEAELWKRAVNEAKQMGDVRRVMHVRSICNSPEIQRICDDFSSAAYK